MGVKSWAILYRGVLSGCNYDCNYCPFAKRVDDRATLARDAADLQRFVDWVAKREESIGILFTPWGEGLIRRHYQEAMLQLSQLPQVRKVAIQTNLSARLDWVQRSDRNKIAFWATYHPSQVDRDKFLAQCRKLDEWGVRYSVGMVGLKQDLEEIEHMRAALPDSVYLWVNAYKRERPYYAPEEVDRIVQVDPLFAWNNQRHASLGKACKAGETAFSVDGAGNLYRCHFIRPEIGNIYEAGFESALKPRLCTNSTCGCHIGYVHLEELRMYKLFGDGILERVPEGFEAAASR
jgi:MoaA/NifB/PqqE/SkfB family radical SAM enzyme